VDHVKSGILILVAACALSGQDGKLTADAAKKLKNPNAFTKKSISKGRDTFLRNCVGCHGDNGKAQIDVVANATDLTDPKGYRDGTSDGEIFRSIRDGAGASMPSFKSEIAKEDDLWNLVNFIHSLWPPDAQPPLQEKDKNP
jgi:mono/diheme cytochrome c family protein